MYTKVTIEVDGLHWHCLSCEQKYQHGDSIDAHLLFCHVDLLSSESSPSLPPTTSFAAAAPDDDISEGEDDYPMYDDDDFNSLTTTDLNSSDKQESNYEGYSGSVPTSPVRVQKKQTALSKRKTRTAAAVEKSRAKCANLDLTDSEPSEEVPTLRKSRRSLTIKNKTEQSKSASSKRKTDSVTAEKRVMVSSKKKTDSETAEKRITVTSKRKTDSGTTEKKVSLSVSSKRKMDSGTAEKSVPGRKRKRLTAESGSSDGHELKDSTSKENSQSSLDEEDTEVSLPKRKSGRSKSAVKATKETVRRKLKTVDRETKKYSWGGKPVKRSREVTSMEMKKLKRSYVSSEQSWNVKDKVRSRIQKPTPEEMALLSSAQINGGLGSREGCSGLDSVPLENDDHLLSPDKTVHTTTAPNHHLMHEKHTDTTGGGSGTVQTSVVNGAYGNDISSISRVLSTLQVTSDQSVIADGQQSTAGSGVLGGPYTHPVTHGDMHPPSNWMGTSAYEASSSSPGVTQLQALLLTDKPHTHNSYPSFQNPLDSSGSAPQVMGAFHNNHDNDSPEDLGENVGSGESIKSKTPNFSFSKIKRPACTEKPSVSNVYECEICQAKFSSLERLSEHEFELSLHQQAECQSCQRMFHNAYDLNFHVFEDHERRSKPFCFLCQEKFQNMAAFEKHLYRHKHDRDPDLLKTEYYACHICQVDIPCRFETLRKHYNKHKQTLCLECYVRAELVLLPDSPSVQEHKKVHAHFCNSCVQDFPSADTLSGHYPCVAERVQREDGQGVVCERCNVWCPNKALTTLHHKEHRLEGMRKWREEKWAVGLACVHCDKVLSNKRNLERHMLHLHSQSPRSYSFHCEYCGKGVDSRNILKDHIAVNHLGIKRYRCQYCSLRFASSTTLRRHTLKEHATDKQYACDQCGERFCEKIKLTRHMYVHTGSARFMCEQCGKGFHSRSEFRKHTAVHEDRRGFPCLGCGQKYKRKEHLKRHYQKCNKAGSSCAEDDIPQPQLVVAPGLLQH